MSNPSPLFRFGKFAHTMKDDNLPPWLHMASKLHEEVLGFAVKALHVAFRGVQSMRGPPLPLGDDRHALGLELLGLQQLPVDVLEPPVALELPEATRPAAQPVLILPLQQLQDQVFRDGINVRWKLHLPLGIHNPLHHHHRIARLGLIEGLLAGQQHISEHPERPKIDAVTVALGEHILRRHVTRRAAKGVRGLVFERPQVLRESKVSQLDEPFLVH
mmetsp:Transcript_1461/g.3769  ORF Transcript_1461/g.3769 Transcript_1461/m.3769 type:complete len:217 (-) Transcript_1461:966-1616(-)